MQRNTRNRQLILRLLGEWTDGSPPPHSASTLLYCLENMVEHQWEGYDIPNAVPRKEQVYRTLRDLVKAGLVTITKEKQDPLSNGLPFWENQYQLVGEVDKNAIMKDCQDLHRKVSRAKHGFNLFGAVMDRGLPADEVKPLLAQVKALMQKTHPDKFKGLEVEFKLMQEAAKWIKSGIPLPMPTHGANDNVVLTLTKAR